MAILDFEKAFDKLLILDWSTNYTTMVQEEIYYSGSNLSLLTVNKELFLMAQAYALLPPVWHQESHKDHC